MLGPKRSTVHQTGGRPRWRWWCWSASP